MPKLWWLLVVPACVATLDSPYMAGDDLDDEDTALHPHADGPVTFVDSPDYVDWHNDQGTFRIYKVCKGPLPGPSYLGHDGSVGPGYVATVWNRDGKVVLDDTAVLGHIGPNSGATGLGMFGFHLVRKPADAPVPFTTRDLDADGKPIEGGRDYTAQIAGRWCNANRRPDDYGGYRGFGVRAFSTPANGYYLAPSVTGNVGQFAIEVVLGDMAADLVALRYTYQISSTAVKVWVRVTNVCSDGTCPGGTAYVKEPKLIAGINPAEPDAIDLAQMNMFDDTGHTATTLDRHNYWINSCSSSPGAPDTKNNFLCEWGGKNPRAEGGGGTGQCNDPDRRRVRFWNPERTCASDPSCLVVAARSADTELGTTYPWQSDHGLDLWAKRNVSEGRERAGAVDTLADGYLEANNCRGDSSAIANRRWEMAGYDKTAACSYTEAVASFHGWEGGTGTYDCEPLYYRFGHSPTDARETYVAALSFGFGAAPLP